ncbi:uncharacterized protein LOC121378974 [Gigantopelta aegis]|uniref:uncharacterized protein LOC121378974 n=1 Tax=Gigantopelta aegis TaxID=1735272 RepID=UPI001B889D9B|nr:uncharacterized protein LOC121378974 [Gigantopelta aegis]XP_041363323.1 uncharacterized protein LOC121378974 [Gigantopelta aegis]
MEEGPIRLGREFFEKSCEELSRALIGQILVRLSDGKRLAGRIVETEAYLGLVDKAAHSYKGKTARCAAMFMEPGTAYVYNIYGTYCCMNISSQGDGCAVLLRALEPLEGINDMSVFRWANPKPCFKVVDLCNGPSKLCQSLSLSKANFDQHDLVNDESLWLEKGGVVPDSMVVQTKRVNIDTAEEWSSKPLRFYLLGSEFVSVKDRQAERQMAGADEFASGDAEDVPLSLLRYGFDKQDTNKTPEKYKSGVSQLKKTPNSDVKSNTKRLLETSDTSTKRKQQCPDDTPPSSKKRTRSETAVSSPSKPITTGTSSPSRTSTTDTSSPSKSNTVVQPSPSKDSSTLVSKDENSGVTSPRKGRGRPKKNVVAMKENQEVDNCGRNPTSTDQPEHVENTETDTPMEDTEESEKKPAEETKKIKVVTPVPTRMKRTIRFVDVPKGTSLPHMFFVCSSVDLAKALLGQRLVRIQDGRRISGKIVETEAYLGVKDKGSIAFGGKFTKNADMFMPPGTIFISSVYGHYFCLSICSEDDGGVVLLRSLEADEGRDLMMLNRYRKSIRDTEICNGPSKLCQALKIDSATFANQNIASSENLFLEREDNVSTNNIVCTKRIITEGDPEDWAEMKLRFYVFGSDCVSSRDPVAEAPLKSSQYDLDQ